MNKEVIETAKKQQDTGTGEKVLSTGVRVRVQPVSARLLTECMARVPKVPVPMWYDKDREKEVPNPADPQYLRDLEERSNQQNNVVMDALIMFGVNLVDGIPDDGWEKKLKLLEKAGAISLEGIDLEDDVEREFAYKKFVAVTAADMELLQEASGVITEDALDIARESFPGDEGGGAD